MNIIKKLLVTETPKTITKVYIDYVKEVKDDGGKISSKVFTRDYFRKNKK